jgi:hypothetical protein
VEIFGCAGQDSGAKNVKVRLGEGYRRYQYVVMFGRIK